MGRYKFVSTALGVVPLDISLFFAGIQIFVRGVPFSLARDCAESESRMSMSLLHWQPPDACEWIDACAQASVLCSYDLHSALPVQWSETSKMR